MMAGYGLWTDIRHDIMPVPDRRRRTGQIEVPRAEDGHYYLTLRRSTGREVPFMVDTGASGHGAEPARTRNGWGSIA